MRPMVSMPMPCTPEEGQSRALCTAMHGIAQRKACRSWALMIEVIQLTLHVRTALWQVRMIQSRKQKDAENNAARKTTECAKKSETVTSENACHSTVSVRVKRD